MSYEVVNMEDCASNFASYKVPGSSGTYEVTLGGESFVHCQDLENDVPCLGFSYRGDCKHIRYVWDNACLYNPQYHDGGPATLKPEYDERQPGFLADGKCPACGGPTVAVKRAV